VRPEASRLAPVAATPPTSNALARSDPVESSYISRTPASSDDCHDATPENPEGLNSSCSEPGYHLRLGCTMVCALIRCAGQSGVCARVYANDAVAGTLAELLFVMVAFEDGQGLLSLLLFGLQLQNIELVRKKLISWWPWHRVAAEPWRRPRVPLSTSTDGRLPLASLADSSSRVGGQTTPLTSRAPTTVDSLTTVEEHIAIWRA